MEDGLPTPSHRLFAHYPNPQRLPDLAAAFVIARLLEEGDSRDLRWLTTRYSEPQLASWFEKHGARQLSLRSCSFWEVIFDRPASPPTVIRGELWPL